MRGTEEPTTVTSSPTASPSRRTRPSPATAVRSPTAPAWTHVPLSREKNVAGSAARTTTGSPRTVPRLRISGLTIRAHGCPVRFCTRLSLTEYGPLPCVTRYASPARMRVGTPGRAEDRPGGPEEEGAQE